MAECKPRRQFHAAARGVIPLLKLAPNGSRVVVIIGSKNVPRARTRRRQRNCLGLESRG